MTLLSSRNNQQLLAVSVPVENANDARYRAMAGEFSGVVELDLGDGVCTGALLTSGEHVLTAAHCFEAEEYTGTPTYEPAADKVRVIFHLAEGSQVIAAQTIHIHPNWKNLDGSNADLAIIKLANPAPQTAERYELYRGSAEVGQVFTRVGFGTRSNGTQGEVSPEKDDAVPIMRFGQNRYDALGEIFNEADTPPESYVEPGEQLAYDFDDGTPEHDAFGVEFALPDLGLGDQEIGASTGDSGGPAFIDGQIAGVASTGLSPTR